MHVKISRTVPFVMRQKCIYSLRDRSRIRTSFRCIKKKRIKKKNQIDFFLEQ